MNTPYLHISLAQLFFISLFMWMTLLIIIGNNLVSSEIKAHLSSCFHMKDLGPLKYLFGTEIARTKKGIFISISRNMFCIYYRILVLLGSSPLTFLWNKIISLERPRVICCLILIRINALSAILFISYSHISTLLILYRFCLSLCTNLARITRIQLSVLFVILRELLIKVFFFELVKIYNFGHTVILIRSAAPSHVNP